MNVLKLIVIGRITKDAKIWPANGDRQALASFNLAVNTGKDRATFVECELRGDRVAKLAQYLVKGKELYVDGSPFVGAYSNNEGHPVGTQKLWVNDIQLGSDSQRNDEGDDPA